MHGQAVTTRGVGTKLWHWSDDPRHLSSQCWSSAQIDTGPRPGQMGTILSVKSRAETSGGHATPLKGGPCPRAVTGDPGLTTGQCQCHSPQTPSLDPVWCLSPVCSHRGLVTSWLSLISGQLWRMARCNNVLMRCQHGVNYVVCKQ